MLNYLMVRVKSKLIEKSREALIELNRSLSPEERMEAFYNHSQLLAQLFAAGKNNPDKRKQK